MIPIIFASLDFQLGNPNETGVVFFFRLLLVLLAKMTKKYYVLFPGGGGVTWVNFAGYVPLAVQSPYPIIVYSVANYRPHISHSWENM